MAITSGLIREMDPCGASILRKYQTVRKQPELDQTREVSVAELKTKRTAASVDDFLDSIKHDQVREDCRTIADIMGEAVKAKPEMWGPSIVGFGKYKYKYADGREMDWMLIAFSPRKQNITLYIRSDFEGYDELMSNLGTHSCGKSCIYIKRLSDVHMPTLRKLINASVQSVSKSA
jgi:hypothetical protein